AGTVGVVAGGIPFHQRVGAPVRRRQRGGGHIVGGTAVGGQRLAGVVQMGQGGLVGREQVSLGGRAAPHVGARDGDGPILVGLGQLGAAVNAILHRDGSFAFLSVPPA